MRHLVLILLVFFVGQGFSQNARYTFEYHLGGAYNVPMPLTIYQKGYEPLKLTAHFDTESFQIPLYWQFRLARWQNNNSWEFEAIHHKLYMIKNPDEIENFSISHGYNILSILRSQAITVNNHAFLLRYGIGAVLAHPESTIRGKRFNQNSGLFESGYYITGPLLNVAIAKQFELSKRFYLNTEFKFYPSYAKVPIADGYANLYNVPLSLIFGLGINFNP